MNRTALYAEHLKRGAKMTDFHGWEMPLYYTSILEEHACVRSRVGLFDISHMGQVLGSGPGALPTLNALVVSDLEQVGEGRACYTLLMNGQGRIVDDLIVYRLTPQDYLIIVNCANRTKDVEWLRAHQQGQATIRDLSVGRSILAIQGPKSADLLEDVLETNVRSLGRFSVMALPPLQVRRSRRRCGA